MSLSFFNIQFLLTQVYCWKSFKIDILEVVFFKLIVVFISRVVAFRPLFFYEKFIFSCRKHSNFFLCLATRNACVGKLLNAF